MIPPLPVELLSHILDLATSTSYAITVRRDDRRLLRQCCLVSKQFCAVAQPKLWSVFTAQKGGNLEPLNKFPQQAHHIRVLEYEGPHRMDCLVNAAKTLPSLVEVRVIEGILTKADLGAFRYIKHLTLRNFCIASFSSIVLRNLVSLTINLVFPTRQHPLFPAASLPSLRAVYAQGTVWDEALQRPSLTELAHLPLEQVDFVQVNMQNGRAFTPALHDRASVVVLAFSVHFAHLLARISALANFNHLLLECTDFGAGTFDYLFKHQLNQLADLVSTRKTLRSMSLPSTLSASSSLPPLVAAARDALLRVCRTCNVDIVWRPFSRMAEDDISVSRDFWEYAKELKRKKADAAVTQASGSKCRTDGSKLE